MEEMTSCLWTTGLIMLAAGVGIGFLLAGRLLPGERRRRELEQELAKVKEELSDYREEVAGHFARTGVLFRGMTDSYRAVYDHLAAGAHQLCPDGAKTLRLELPTTPMLPDGDGKGEDAVEPDAEAVEAAAAVQVRKEPTEPAVEEAPVPPAAGPDQAEALAPDEPLAVDGPPEEPPEAKPKTETERRAAAGPEAEPPVREPGTERTDEGGAAAGAKPTGAEDAIPATESDAPAPPEPRRESERPVTH